jgi:hypothetical protein
MSRTAGSRAAFWLALLVAALAMAASGAGLLWGGGSCPWEFSTLRGGVARMFGRGLYRYDTLFTGAGFRGQDLVTLFLGVPALVLAAALHRRGSRRVSALLLGVLGWFLYAYASMSLGAAYNPLFLLYVALFSASFFALAATFGSLELDAGRLPRRGPAVFLFAGGVVTLVVWLAPLLQGLAAGRPPELLASYTTLVTDVLDLGLITPAAILGGVLILRRSAMGYRIAFALLGIILFLLPAIILSTLFQLRAGVDFTAGEVIGPIAGFAALGLSAVWVLAAIISKIPAVNPKAGG